MPNPRGQQTRIAIILLAGLLTSLAVVGCSTPMRARATDYRLHLDLDPERHQLNCVAEIVCASPDAPTKAAGQCVELTLALHPKLEVRNVSADPMDVKSWRSEPSASTDGFAPVLHHVKLTRWAEQFTLKVEYGGELVQDVAAGEKRGEIHNFAVSAHVGEDGVYLDGGGNWYPRVHESSAVTDKELARYCVEIEPVEEFTFVAGADGTAPPQPGSRLVVESAFPQTDMAVVGGRFRTWSRDVDGIRFAILLHPKDVDDATLERRANLFLDAAIGYVQRYQPLVGPYPFDEFTIVENFFSSGFAFPTFTLLGPMVIAMEDRALRHGYLDHELLHSWWGNALYVDHDEGNWCEALASYGANLYGYVLDNDEVGARKHRRDTCNALSRASARNDKPLDTYGRENGASRTIGYQKGAMVFHMLSRRMGVETFWSALRAMNAENVGRHVSWSTIRAACEREADQDLVDFFDQWVHGCGAPRFALTRAEPGEGNGQVVVEIHQEDTPFTVDLPLRIHQADGSQRDTIVAVSGETTRAALSQVRLPAEIELDPDFHVARKLAPIEVMPTLAGVHRGDACQLIVPNGDLWPGYEVFAGDVVKKRKADATTRLTVDELADVELSAPTIAIVGEAVRSPAVTALLARSECPVRWTENGFQIEGEDYSSASHAVLCSIRHPDHPGHTITMYYGNSAESLSNAGILWFYGNSLLVYNTPEGGGHAAVIRRMDFERTHQIRVSGPEMAAVGPGN